jgi:hypothetical protein
MIHQIMYLVIFILVAGIYGCSESNSEDKLIAKIYNSGFDHAHDTYNAISRASDGNIYYVHSSDRLDVGAQMYRFEPNTEEIVHIADLTTVCGEDSLQAIPQGKSHVNFYEMEKVLYFATHVGYYQIINGMERLPQTPPNGYNLYPGGHILAYDLEHEEFEDLALAPDGEGIITMVMDTSRGQIYCITWPKGYFLHYDVNVDTLYNLGSISAGGEAGVPGEDFRTLCRSMVVDPRDGHVYYSTSEGWIFMYHPESQSMSRVNTSLKLDYFGYYDPTRPGSMGYNWRRIVWYEPEQIAYGVHGNSGYLFKFDPSKPSVELVKRLTSEPSQRSGMFDQFSYGYLGFELGPKMEIIYYLTGGPIFINGKRVVGKDHINMGAARGLENLHLVTYNIPKKQYADHGAVFYENGKRPTYVNSIAMDFHGQVYTLARISTGDNYDIDLIQIPNPF